ncbi:hypothetical protein [Streptosporangium sp. NPDC048865]|uniref:hypothetical protein n=1 Tax=Streptosporangium sp. NPDC048865 TaxID=3155766 RepID=UPI00343C4676
MATNEARDGDVQSVQAGRVLGQSREEILAARMEAKATSLAKTGGKTQNVREGNARVGIQADAIDGGITVIM